MARTKDFGNMRPGRRRAADFRSLISPLGHDVEQTPDNSPSREVGQKQAKGRASQSESSKNDRRGG